MALATSLRKTASKLMAKFGGVATIRTVTAGTYNPTTGTVSETTADTVVRGVLENVNLREVDGAVQATDKILTIAAADLTVAPSVSDRVIINEILYQVVRISTTEQDNTPITHELVLRA